jgi:hypothetical protein
MSDQDHRQLAGRGTIILAMSIDLYGCDCQECHSEILVNLESAHRPFGDNEKMLYRVVCGTCGLSYDVHFEDLRLCDKSDTEHTQRAAITTFARK